MTEIILSDNSIYTLKEDEILSYGNTGVYVWKNKTDNYPPLRFFVYGYVKEVRIT
jgi:hypothetical protein